MIKIDVSANTDEVIAAINTKKKTVIDAVERKMNFVVETVAHDLLSGLPGKYLDPSTIQYNVSRVPGGVIGYIESRDKGGTYPIVPVKARALHFFWKRLGVEVFTKRVNRPYLKGSTFVEARMNELKPWIEAQITDVGEDF